MLVGRAARVGIFASLVVSVSACSTSGKSTLFDEHQQAALQRWNNCIERERADHKGSILDVHQAVSAQCEGHQRDVLATYPEHLENQVDALLSDRATALTTEHFLRSRNLTNWQGTFSEDLHH